MAKKIPLIGLLGGIGSGKSLVAEQFRQLGCPVIDADRMAKAMLDQPDIRQQLVQWWGSSILDEQGKVARPAIAKIVFGNPAERKRLESLIHPRVLAERAKRIAQYRRELEDRDARQAGVTAGEIESGRGIGGGIGVVVDDTPLLMELGLDHECDVLVFVDAPLEVRLGRVMERRGWSKQELEKREKEQTPLDNKAKRADYVIVNDADPSHCFEQVRRILSHLLPTEPVK